jgi:CubicO group peptidase (beta-lactamase class C family)
MHRQIKLLILTGLLLHSTLLLSQLSIEQNEFKALSEEIHKIVKDTKAVGVSVAVIHNYEVVWAKGFGVISVGSNDSVTTQTVFQAASISKSITALTVMKKVQDGKITLTGNVDDQLISWHIPKTNFTNQSSLTVKQLLSHTGGVANSFYHIPGYKEGNKLPNIIECLNGTKPAENDPVKIVNIPGTKFSYSNCGYWILEALLQDVEKQEYEEIVNAEIFAPLEMMNSTFKSSPPNAMFKSVAVGHLKNNIPIDGKYYFVRPLSSGGMWSTPIDLAKFLIEMQKSRNGDSNKIIDKDNAILMTKPVMAQYGLGFSNEIRGTGVKFFGHDGHNVGYICSMIGSLDDGFGVVVMTNSENGWKAVNKIKKIVGRKFWGF